MEKESSVTPWEVKGEVDYARLLREFGISPIKELPPQLKDEFLFRRGVIFAQRDLKQILSAIGSKKPFVMMTGMMPTGKFHIGHILVAKQMMLFQKLGAKLYIAVADIEAYLARTQSLETSRQIAINDYILNYIALGLNKENCEIYFQSSRSKNSEKANSFYRLQALLSRYVTFNEFKAIYGDISPGKMSAALLQAADMLHPQLPEFEGQIPVVVPVGIDQDPHLRLARDLSQRIKDYKFVQLSSTYNIFLPGLSGGKMSASDPSSYIALTDTEKEVEKKIKKYAFSGGKDTIAEHRKLGGNPDIDVCFQYLKLLFEEDDKKLASIYNNYKSGKMLSSELKDYTIKKINSFLKEHQKKREEAKKRLGEFIKLN